MRILVAKENEHLPDGRWIMPGALVETEDHPIPVIYGSNVGQVVGFASALQRDGNEVSMEIEFHPAARYLVDCQPEEFLASCWCKPVTTDPENNYVIITGTIREVRVALHPGWPKGANV